MHRIQTLSHHLTSGRAERRRLLIANRGEIAIRIFTAAKALGFDVVVVYSTDDERSLHVKRCDHAVCLRQHGPTAYLNTDNLVRIAKEHRCGYVHPGYGFHSENAAFAQACVDAGIVFVGPSVEALRVFGDKTLSRKLALDAGVPVVPGVEADPGQPLEIFQQQVKQFFLQAQKQRPNAAIIVKASNGGGGKGIRVVRTADDISDAIERCDSEARRFFGGKGTLFAELFLENCKHVEIQVIGDGASHVAFVERDCSVQLHRQKFIELTPCPTITPATRHQLMGFATALAKASKYQSAGTFEFLMDVRSKECFFIEGNPRLQVEHTITEAIYSGVDLVEAQLRIACGDRVRDLPWHQGKLLPRGYAMQLRINRMSDRFKTPGEPLHDRIVTFQFPHDKAVSVHTHAYEGYQPSAQFDALLAKLVVRTSSPDFSVCVDEAIRAVCSSQVSGISHNLRLILAVLEHEVFRGSQNCTTAFVEANMEQILLKLDALSPPELFYRSEPQAQSQRSDVEGVQSVSPPGTLGVVAPMQGVVESIDVSVGDRVEARKTLIAVLSAMKMEHEVHAETDGIVEQVNFIDGETVQPNDVLVSIRPLSTTGVSNEDQRGSIDYDTYSRPDLEEVHHRASIATDDVMHRPHRLEKRRNRTPNLRTARDNVEDLCETGTFVEYGKFAIAKQEYRRSKDDLVMNTPADGLVCGIGVVNRAERFESTRSAHQFNCAILSYDYMTLAGTQGYRNHLKKDRLLEIAHRLRLPVVFFTEGGGGRPGDDSSKIAGLDVDAFRLFGQLSGWVPTVGIVSGNCFAGNAALLGMCDLTIATRGASLGMGGPAMIKGGGLGTYKPSEVGPVDMHFEQGVIDVLVQDEETAVRVAKQYLSYFQGRAKTWTAAEQRELRSIIPLNRKRGYDMMRVIHCLADEGSVLPIRGGYGQGMITCLARIEGRPLGIVANNPKHISGAIDCDGADKAARFMKLCDAHDLAILFLCDTPGMMVGPEVERQGLVRHAARLFVVGASITVPTFTVVTRKSYGLGAQAMGGGTHKAPVFTVAWPSGEFGAMGIEGAVELGFSKELAAVANLEERQALFESKVAQAYEHGKALNLATHLEIDDVIDPADTRRLVARGLSMSTGRLNDAPRKRVVDTW